MSWWVTYLTCVNRVVTSSQMILLCVPHVSFQPSGQNSLSKCHFWFSKCVCKQWCVESMHWLSKYTVTVVEIRIFQFNILLKGYFVCSHNTNMMSLPIGWWRMVRDVPCVVKLCLLKKFLLLPTGSQLFLVLIHRSSDCIPKLRYIFLLSV